MTDNRLFEDNLPAVNNSNRPGEEEIEDFHNFKPKAGALPRSRKVSNISNGQRKQSQKNNGQEPHYIPMDGDKLSQEDDFPLYTYRHFNLFIYFLASMIG